MATPAPAAPVNAPNVPAWVRDIHEPTSRVFLGLLLASLTTGLVWATAFSLFGLAFVKSNTQPPFWYPLSSGFFAVYYPLKAREMWIRRRKALSDMRDREGEAAVDELAGGEKLSSKEEIMEEVREVKMKA